MFDQNFGTPEGPSSVSQCCCRYLIAVYNSNLAKDDNFDIKVNGTLIGSIDNNEIGVCTGKIWHTGAAGITLSGVTSCTPAGGIHTLADGILVTGSNVLSIIRTQDNGNNNFGTVLIATIRGNGTDWVVFSTIVNSTYIGGSGLGPLANYPFTL